MTKGTLGLCAAMIGGTMLFTLTGVLVYGGAVGEATMAVGARLAAAGGRQPLLTVEEAEAVVEDIAQRRVTEIAVKLIPGRVTVVKR